MKNIYAAKLFANAHLTEYLMFYGKQNVLMTQLKASKFLNSFKIDFSGKLKHTKKEMKYIDKWIKNLIKKKYLPVILQSLTMQIMLTTFKSS